MTQQIRVGLSISDRGDSDRATPQVLMQVSGVPGDVVHVQVEARGFLPSSDGAVAIADMLNDVAQAILQKVADAQDSRPVPTEDELAASARIQAAYAEGEDHEVLVRTRRRQHDIDYAVSQLIQCGITHADATEAAEKAVDLAMAGTTGSARRAAAVVMDPRIHSQPAVTAAVNVLRNVATPEPMHPQDPERWATPRNASPLAPDPVHQPVDTGRVSYLAHEQDVAAEMNERRDAWSEDEDRTAGQVERNVRNFQTPQRVVDARAARKEERAADKRARFNPKPSR